MDNQAGSEDDAQFDVFSICEFLTDPKQAEADLRMFMAAGMPADIHIGAVREGLPEARQGSRLSHVVIESVNPTNLSQVALAKKLVMVLLEFGAVWNTLDSTDQTPACIAANRGVSELYDLFVSAGVRSELVLRRLLEQDPSDSASEDNGEGKSKPEEVQGDYLKNDVKYTDSALLTDQGDGVMMDWETPLMREHAQHMAPVPGKKVLNIGFGMGIIDTFLQERAPGEHVIIEAHPNVLAKIDKEGWPDRAGVRIMRESWKTALPKLIAEGAVFDGIFYDTFSEHYTDMLELFDYVVGLLSFDGVFSYFNGLGADRQVCYDVYKQVAEFDLKQLGLAIEFKPITVQLPSQTWNGLKRPYFTLEEYALPLVTFSQEAESEQSIDEAEQLTDEEVFI